MAYVREQTRERLEARIRSCIEADIRAGIPTSARYIALHEFRELLDILNGKAFPSSRPCRDPSSYAARAMACAGTMEVPRIDLGRSCMTLALGGCTWTVSWFGAFLPESAVSILPHGFLEREITCPLPPPEGLVELDWWISWLEKAVPGIEREVRKEDLLRRMREIEREAGSSER